MSKPGVFISVEGIEGVGKSSNVHYLADKIRALDHNATLTREPGGTPIAEDLRGVLLKAYPEKTLPKTELLLLYAGRLQHVENVIQPAIKKGDWVICDRFEDATYAYQGGGRHIPIEVIDVLSQWTLGGFSPDVTILLDASPEIALGRIQKERELDRFETEQMSFFENIRKQYLDRANSDPNRYYLVNAAEPLEKVQARLDEVVASLEQRYG